MVAPDTGVTVTSAVVGLVGKAVMIAGAPSAGVLACAGADGGVALPPESVATTWTVYVVPGTRVVREHAAVEQVSVLVLPPAMGTAVMV
jgi:hypothetical protein